MNTPTTSTNQWDRLPDEGADAYARFLEYRNQTPGKRTFAAIAETFGVSEPAIHQQARRYRWRDRVAAWDRHQADQRRERIADAQLKLAVAEIDVATAMVRAVAKTVAALLRDDNAVLEPAEAARWLDVAEKVRRAAANQPELLVGLTGADGGPIQVQVPELEGLTPEQQRQRVNEALATVTRLADYAQEQGAA